jgi:hypothetical protein
VRDERGQRLCQPREIGLNHEQFVAHGLYLSPPADMQERGEAILS